jgi:hypothetical protein
MESESLKLPEPSRLHRPLMRMLYLTVCQGMSGFISMGRVSTSNCCKHSNSASGSMQTQSFLAGFSGRILLHTDREASSVGIVIITIIIVIINQMHAFMYRDRVCLVHERYDESGKVWGKRNNNKRFRKCEKYIREIFNTVIIKDSCITHILKVLQPET